MVLEYSRSAITFLEIKREPQSVGVINYNLSNVLNYWHLMCVLSVEGK